MTSRLVMAVGFDAATLDQQRVAPRWWMTRAWTREPHRGYPDYESLWPQFAEDLDTLAGDFAQAGRATPSPTECELAYVNPITAVEPWAAHTHVERLLLRWFGEHDTGGLLPPPDDIAADAQFSMPPSGEAPAGRLTIETRWLSVEGPGQVMGMTLSARSRVCDGRLASVRAFFDHALEWIIRGFAVLTADAPVGAPEAVALRGKR